MIRIVDFLFVFCDHVRYRVTMIKSFRDNWLYNFFVKDIHSKKIPAIIRSRIFRKLQLLDDATCDIDLKKFTRQSF